MYAMGQCLMLWWSVGLEHTGRNLNSFSVRNAKRSAWYVPKALEKTKNITLFRSVARYSGCESGRRTCPPPSTLFSYAVGFSRILLILLSVLSFMIYLCLL